MKKSELLLKLKKRTARIGIIGMGYVGLPLAREFLQAGFRVTGFDIDKKKVDKLKHGKSYIRHIDNDFLKEFVFRKKTFSATCSFNELQAMDYVLICVPTPLGAHDEPDLSYIEKTTATVARYLRPLQTVILESTTYPGTTEEVLLPILQAKGKKVGRDFILGYSPEREDPGNPDFPTRRIPKVVSSVTKKDLDIIDGLYQQIAKTFPVSSTRVAEASKILENTYRAVNIALVNELKMLFDRMGIDIWEIIAAAKTKPFGFQPFYPGPGLGGHCIPIDPFYLTYKAKEYGFATRFIELAGQINTMQPHYVIERTNAALNSYGKSLKGSRILLLGIAYKKDVDDARESPALRIYDILISKGAKVDYYDPYIPRLGPLRRYPKLNIRSIKYSLRALRKYDLVLLVTDHSTFRYQEILANAKLIVDTRNAFSRRSRRLFKA